MTILHNQTFDAYVPSDGAQLYAISNLTPAYIPFETLQLVPLSRAHTESFAYAKRLTPPSIFNHVLRCFYFGLALLYTGFPSRTPGVPQISFNELTMRLYHTTILHDLGMSNIPEGMHDPSHGMTFELQSAVMAYNHLHKAAPELDAYQVGDIVDCGQLFGESDVNVPRVVVRRRGVQWYRFARDEFHEPVESQDGAGDRDEVPSGPILQRGVEQV
ncbi:hypothetical protein FB45DRAFT_922339 [Roridomyces roridus]|uniref:HD domain-containing protein n=1 Tax=Roridomyces roridus TaxID=1738132 RepID=A0AAD7BMX3_9AGAR|nr:hypothetical protein FB45DRAFT_922339 [Roridomyces roridus]